MTAFDRMKLLRLRKILIFYSVKVSSSPNSPLLFAIAFWGKTNRSSLSKLLFNIGVPKTFPNFAGKHQCWSLFLSKKRLQHRGFTVKFAKFLRSPFSTEHLRWLPLNKHWRSLWFILWRGDTLVIWQVYPGCSIAF